MGNKPSPADIVEQTRLDQARHSNMPWKKWGPYLSERQWGTVREDYSHDGDAWSYLPHDQARSRAYRWGEDGLGGISDDRQRLCFALSLWNERDPILKERLFGLTKSEGNHGEDVKEIYFYIESTPTHSYMKYLYKYPQREFPYSDLVETNGRRSRQEPEYELLDTGIFDDDRYFDVFVEYAKGAPEDVLVRITVHNRGPEDARLHVLPTLWFRNTWASGEDKHKPILRQRGPGAIAASHEAVGDYTFMCEGNVELLFTENETNAQRLWGHPNSSPYVKDAFHEYVINKRKDATNPAMTGTKAAAHYQLQVPSGGSQVIRLRLVDAQSPNVLIEPASFDRVFQERIAEADEFFDRITAPALKEDERSRVFRQAIAGMMWTKQYYYFDLERWLDEHHANPLANGARGSTRNTEWFHMLNRDIISMPDKWEFPWYAAWDLAFHTLGLALVDMDFAKEQQFLMLRNLYLHPNGQIPAYEWNFSDVNPPVHAWSTLFLYEVENQWGKPDLVFLENCFQRLLVNFTWWVNRKDPEGRNVFAGGFLGLDNIGVFDRSAHLPTGGTLEQADGTAWIALFCQIMFEIALILTEHNPVYEGMAYRFFEHFVWIAYAMDRIGDRHDKMWDEEDGFYYDLLRLPDGQAVRLKVRSLVGLLPLCASFAIERRDAANLPWMNELIDTFRQRHPEVIEHIAPADNSFVGYNQRQLLSAVNKRKLERILKYMLDENEFLGPYGIRSLSRYHLDHPYSFWVGSEEFKVQYSPAESDNDMFGGNSNWRGPVWIPANALMLGALVHLYQFYGNDFKVECPTGSGRYMNLFEVAQEITHRLEKIFLRDQNGDRPSHGGARKFREDPYWRDYILFNEYFHGDNGAGLGAAHQTGWTGIIATIMSVFARLSATQALDFGKGKIAATMAQPRSKEQKTA